MILDGLKRIVGSAKVQLLASAAFGAVTTYLLTPGSREDKAGLLNTMVVTLGALVGAVILGWAHEDSAAKSAPQNQTNVNSAVTNQPTTTAPVPSEPVSTPHPTDTLTDAQIDAILHRLAVRQQAARAAHPAPLDTPKGN